MNTDHVVHPRRPPPATPRELVQRIVQSVRAVMTAYNAYRLPPQKREIVRRDVAE
jgi:hypothetical protein